MISDSGFILQLTQESIKKLIADLDITDQAKVLSEKFVYDIESNYLLNERDKILIKDAFQAGYKKYWTIH